MNDKIKINYATALTLRNSCEKILYEDQFDGSRKERPISFRLKYKINKNYALLEKDAKDFENLKLQILAIYGDPTEDGQNVVVKDPKKVDAFMKAINTILMQEVTHTITKIDESDLECLTGKVNIPYQELSLFQAYMCDEPELLRQLSENLQFKIELPVIEEESTPEVKKPTKKRTIKKKKTEETTNE